MPSSNSCDDFIWIGGPIEWLWFNVVFLDEPVDGGLEIDDGMEHTTLEPSFGEFGKKTFDGVDPGTRCGREVEGPARVAFEPFSDLGMFMGGVVVDDGVDHFSRWYVALDNIEESDEFLMPVALHVTADDGTVEHIQRREQCCRAVTFVIVCHGAATASLHGQAGLGTVQRLDLAFLIHRQNDRVGRRIHIEADDISDLFDECGIVRQLENPEPVRLKAVGTPYPLHRTNRNTGCLGHRGAGPMGGLKGRRFLGQREYLINLGSRKRRNTGRSRFILQQPVNALAHVPFLPAPHRCFAFPGAMHDLVGSNPGVAQKNDFGPPGMFPRTVAIRGDGFKTTPINRGNRDGYSLLHDVDSHNPSQKGIPKGTLPLGSIH